MSITNLREYQTRRLESAADRMAEALETMRLPDELRTLWGGRLDMAAQRRILEAEAGKPGDGLPALWRKLLAVETGWRRVVNEAG